MRIASDLGLGLGAQHSFLLNSADFKECCEANQNNFVMNFFSNLLVAYSSDRFNLLEEVDVLEKNPLGEALKKLSPQDKADFFYTCLVKSSAQSKHQEEFVKLMCANSWFSDTIRDALSDTRVKDDQIKGVVSAAHRNLDKSFSGFARWFFQSGIHKKRQYTKKNLSDIFTHENMWVDMFKDGVLKDFEEAWDAYDHLVKAKNIDIQKTGTLRDDYARYLASKSKKNLKENIDKIIKKHKNSPKMM